MVGLRPEWAVKAIVVIIITSILFRCVSAVTNHTVGGASGWDLTSNLQGWTAETTVRVGDFLGTLSFPALISSPFLAHACMQLIFPTFSCN